MSSQVGPTVLGNWEWRHIPERQETFYDSAELFLTSFWGGEKRGRSLQITILQQNGSAAYIQLNAFAANQLKELIEEWQKGN